VKTPPCILPFSNIPTHIMAEQIKQVFAAKKAEGEPAFVTFVTAGYPRPQDTVPNMLALEAGGADIIELGVPFSDPTADGPTIQEANTVRFWVSCWKACP
jgi:tryptophan synthase alpha subunit